MTKKNIWVVAVSILLAIVGQGIFSTAAESKAMKEVSSIVITGFPKTVYYQYADTKVSYQGLTVEMTYEDQTTETVVYGEKDSQNQEMKVSTTLDLQLSPTEKSYVCTVSLGGREAYYSVTYRDFSKITPTELVCGQTYAMEADGPVKSRVYRFTTGADGGILVKFQAQAEYRIYREADMGKVGRWTTKGGAEAPRVIHLLPETKYYLMVSPDGETVSEIRSLQIWKMEAADRISMAELPIQTYDTAGMVSQIPFGDFKLKVHYASGYEEIVSSAGSTLQGEGFLVTENFSYDERGMILPGIYQVKIFLRQHEEISTGFPVTVRLPAEEESQESQNPQNPQNSQGIQGKIDLSKCSVKLSQTSFVYTGKEIRPGVIVTCQGQVIDTAAYELSYGNNRKSGIGTVVITGRGSCTGRKEQTFRIVPRAVQGVKVKAAKKKMVVSWKKRAEADGYEIYTSAKKTKGYQKTAVIKSKRTVKKRLQKGKGKKFFYVKLRAYVVSDGKKIYGTYTRAKGVRIT